MSFPKGLCYCAIIGFIFFIRTDFGAAQNSNVTTDNSNAAKGQPESASPPESDSPPGNDCVAHPELCGLTTPTTTTKRPRPPPRERVRWGSRIRKFLLAGPIRRFAWDHQIVKWFYEHPLPMFPIKRLERRLNITEPIKTVIRDVFLPSIRTTFKAVVIPAISSVLIPTPLGPIWIAIRSLYRTSRPIVTAFRIAKRIVRGWARSLLHLSVVVREHKPLGHAAYAVLNLLRTGLLIANDVFDFLMTVFLKFVDIVMQVIRHIIKMLIRFAAEMTKVFLYFTREVIKFTIIGTAQFLSFVRYLMVEIMKSAVNATKMALYYLGQVVKMVMNMTRKALMNVLKLLSNLRRPRLLPDANKSDSKDNRTLSGRGPIREFLNSFRPRSILAGKGPLRRVFFKGGPLRQFFQSIRPKNLIQNLLFRVF